MKIFLRNHMNEFSDKYLKTYVYKVYVFKHDFTVQTTYNGISIFLDKVDLINKYGL